MYSTMQSLKIGTTPDALILNAYASLSSSVSPNVYNHDSDKFNSIFELYWILPSFIILLISNNLINEKNFKYKA